MDDALPHAVSCEGLAACIERRAARLSGDAHIPIPMDMTANLC